MSAETVDGGRLREAATELSDERILREIQGKDLVALEVKYHKRCYEKYTSAQRHGKKATHEKDEEDSSKYGLLYERSFRICCEQFIQPNIIQDNGIFYMKKVKDAFVKTVQAVENLDASGYKITRLKQRMQPPSAGFSNNMSQEQKLSCLF